MWKSYAPQNYYHPDFLGSFSIKKVLPALISEMSYEALDIKNGDEAIAAFVKMAKKSLLNEEIANIRRNLLSYCKQDTLAMVELHKYLFYQHEQKKYLINPEIEPDLSILNGQEKEHIDWELQRLSDLNCKPPIYKTN